MSTARPRARRRAVRPSGTVGHDESVLRSVVPVLAPDAATGRPRDGVAPSAPEPTPTDPIPRPGKRTSAAQRTDLAQRTGPAEADDPAVAGRSLDDRDLGWGERVEDSDDDRLRRDKPPHW